MIRFENVSYTYPGADEVLHDISFSIERGEKVGLIGANGAGKTTILKAALGLIQTTGTITVGGLPMSRENLSEIRKKLGYVLQNSDNQMFMPTVIEDMIFGSVNYGMSRDDAEKKADEVLKDLNIEYLKKRQNHRMSGGEKRLAAIATVLTMEPEALLMDEPSSALDPKNRRNLINLLKRLWDKSRITYVITTHDLDLVLDTCERVIILNNGRIAADGPAEVILRDQALLEANDLELPFCFAGR
ncbi:MAG: energy-coupling factor ABC transporter ATP-binding protein [Lachnospiraceae bacterium]|nr:energy-coupling factor ABC transporter ATP-binding protein [Lachnospiraceae bacterium]